MIHITNINKLEQFNKDNSYVLTDFDRTLTNNKSINSWGILPNNDYVSKEFTKEIQDLYNYYRPIETSNELTIEEKKEILPTWWEQNIDLIVKHQVTEDMVKKAVTSNTMIFRKGVKKFLERTKQFNIPVIIISAGIGNFIEEQLRLEDCYYSNIKIVSNMLKFKNGLATGVTDDLIHVFNKDEITHSEEIKKTISARNKAILFGDSLGDVKMISEDKREESLKIGFLEKEEMKNKSHYYQAFDVVCTANTSYTELFQKVKILK